MSVRNPNVKQRHITLRIDEELIEQMKEAAKRNDRTFSAEVRQAIRVHLKWEREEEVAA